MEGELDMISSTQAHVKQVVAVKGSALTIEQIRLLARTVKTIFLALDADSAGVEATKRAIAIIQPFPVALRVIPITGGKDPDELARQDPAAWRELVKHHVSAFEYVMDHAIAELGIDSAEGQKQVVNTLFSLLTYIENAVERNFYLKQLSQRTGIGENILLEQWQNWQKHQQLSPSRATAKNDQPAVSTQPEIVDKLGTYVLHIILLTEKLDQRSRDLIQPKLFTELAHQRITAALQKYWTQHTTFVLRDFMSTLPTELRDTITTLYTLDVPLEQVDLGRELALSLSQLDQRYRQQQRRQVADDLAQWEKKLGTDPQADAEYARLQKEFTELTLHDGT
jgi:DNA primase